ncbi:hypothetical protein D1871_07965 [Nakamurella silvestris]|nr:hypothetical protein D1871_07965 [Nakamurella silvestris]
MAALVGDKNTQNATLARAQAFDATSHDRATQAIEQDQTDREAALARGQEIQDHLRQRADLETTVDAEAAHRAQLTIDQRQAEERHRTTPGLNTETDQRWPESSFPEAEIDAENDHSIDTAQDYYGPGYAPEDYETDPELGIEGQQL